MPDKKSVKLFSLVFVTAIIAHWVGVMEYWGGIIEALFFSVICTVILSVMFTRKSMNEHIDLRLIRIQRSYLALYSIAGSALLMTVIESCFSYIQPINGVVAGLVAMISLIVLVNTIKKHRQYLSEQNDDTYEVSAIEGKMSLVIPAIILLAVVKRFASTAAESVYDFSLNYMKPFLVETAITAVGAVVIRLIFRNANKLLYWCAAAVLILIYHKHFMTMFMLAYLLLGGDLVYPGGYT